MYKSAVCKESLIDGQNQTDTIKLNCVERVYRLPASPHGNRLASESYSLTQQSQPFITSKLIRLLTIIVIPRCQNSHK